ncbi:hypothetical protein B0T14DRAFT_531109 [Immersiella caudata]|uniref:Uncharacterized protein n=1 Tax=Immersiella caudata TaxID=314043 RepID=A0AA39WC51_9PEZI|nr:hypothetical protein B0T14DRAFT_531109 [Immersiella caudata]
MCATDRCPRGSDPNGVVDVCYLTKHDKPENPDDLAQDDPLTPFVATWASQCLQAYRTSCTSQDLHHLSLAPKPSPPPTTDGSCSLSDYTQDESSTSGTSTGDDAARRRQSRRNPAWLRRAIACPFYKNDPKRFHACGYGVTLRSSLAARYHVYLHHRADVDTPDNTLPKLLTQYEVAASRRGPKHQERSWLRMWDMLFPGAKRPESVYMSSPAERELVALRRWWKRAGPGLVKPLLADEADDEDSLEQVQASILQKMVEQAGIGI